MSELEPAGELTPEPEGTEQKPLWLSFDLARMKRIDFELLKAATVNTPQGEPGSGAIMFGMGAGDYATYYGPTVTDGRNVHPAAAPALILVLTVNHRLFEPVPVGDVLRPLMIYIARPITAVPEGLAVHFPDGGTVTIPVNGWHWREGMTLQDARETLEARWKEQLTKAARPADALKVDSFPVPTSEEWTALMQANADGRTLKNYHANREGREVIHRTPGATYYVRIPVGKDEDMDTLVEFVKGANADSAIGLMYVSELLAPMEPLARGAYAGGRVYLDDILKKIGFDIRTSEQRLALREWVWKSVIQYGHKAVVIGRRTHKYKGQDGKEIDTLIEVSPWAIMNPERPKIPQPKIPGFEVPISIELIASREWTELTTNPKTRQFLPGAEIIGSLPRGQAAGAWARVIAISYGSFARRYPQVLQGKAKPTRRELLTAFEPAKSPPLQILYSDAPRRAIEYWRAALRLLVDCGLLANNGEAKTARKPKGYSWQEAWLNEKVDLQPGPLWAPTLAEIEQKRAAKAVTARPRRTRKNPKV